MEKYYEDATKAYFNGSYNEAIDLFLKSYKISESLIVKFDSLFSAGVSAIKTSNKKHALKYNNMAIELCETFYKTSKREGDYLVIKDTYKNLYPKDHYFATSKYYNTLYNSISFNVVDIDDNDISTRMETLLMLNEIIKKLKKIDYYNINAVELSTAEKILRKEISNIKKIRKANK